MSPMIFGGQLAGFSASGLPPTFVVGRRPALIATLLALLPGAVGAGKPSGLR